MSNVKICGKPKTKTMPNGAIEAFFTRNSKVVKRKSFSIGKRTSEQAYSLALEAGRQLAKQYGVSFDEKPINEVLDQVARIKKLATKPVEKAEQNPLLEAFEHLGRFRALIKSAYKQSGYARVKQVLNESLIILDEVSELERAEKAKQEKLYSDIAKSMFNIYLSSGTDMAEHIACDQAKAIYKNMVKAHKEKPQGKGVYQLNGEKWDGNGNLPASIKSWLREDDSRDLEQLRVG